MNKSWQTWVLTAGVGFMVPVISYIAVSVQELKEFASKYEIYNLKNTEEIVRLRGRIEMMDLKLRDLEIRHAELKKWCERWVNEFKKDRDSD